MSPITPEDLIRVFRESECALSGDYARLLYSLNALFTERAASTADALEAAFHAMDAACRWAAGEATNLRTLEAADRHVAGYDALLDATVKAGQAAGLLSGAHQGKP